MHDVFAQRGIVRPPQREQEGKMVALDALKREDLCETVDNSGRWVHPTISEQAECRGRPLSQRQCDVAMGYARLHAFESLVGGPEIVARIGKGEDGTTHAILQWAFAFSAIDKRVDGRAVDEGRNLRLR